MPNANVYKKSIKTQTAKASPIATGDLRGIANVQSYITGKRRLLGRLKAEKRKDAPPEPKRGRGSKRKKKEEARKRRRKRAKLAPTGGKGPRTLRPRLKGRPVEELALPQTGIGIHRPSPYLSDRSAKKAVRTAPGE